MWGLHSSSGESKVTRSPCGDSHAPATRRLAQARQPPAARLVPRAPRLDATFNLSPRPVIPRCSDDAAEPSCGRQSGRPPSAFHTEVSSLPLRLEATFWSCWRLPDSQPTAGAPRLPILLLCLGSWKRSLLEHLLPLLQKLLHQRILWAVHLRPCALPEQTASCPLVLHEQIP